MKTGNLSIQHHHKVQPLNHLNKRPKNQSSSLNNNNNNWKVVFILKEGGIYCKDIIFHYIVEMFFYFS